MYPGDEGETGLIHVGTRVCIVRGQKRPFGQQKKEKIYKTREDDWSGDGLNLWNKKIDVCFLSVLFFLSGERD